MLRARSNSPNPIFTHFEQHNNTVICDELSAYYILYENDIKLIGKTQHDTLDLATPTP